MRETCFQLFFQPFSLDALAIMVQHAIGKPCWMTGSMWSPQTPEWIASARVATSRQRIACFHFLMKSLSCLEPEEVMLVWHSARCSPTQSKHGGRLDPNQQVEISYLRARHMVTCLITDPGEGFTLDEIPHAAIANPENDALRHVEYREACGMRPGGFGVLLAQRLSINSSTAKRATRSCLSNISTWPHECQPNRDRPSPTALALAAKRKSKPQDQRSSPACCHVYCRCRSRAHSRD